MKNEIGISLIGLGVVGSGVAKQLIREAKECGADFVKFQSFKPEKVISRFAKLAPYQEKAIGKVSNQLDMVREFELSKKHHVEIIEEAKKIEIKFLSNRYFHFISVFLDVGCHLILY